MFDKLEKLPKDALINLTTLCRNDQRADKIDVGVGVFRDDKGITPIMAAVRAAEKQIYDKDITKAYVGIAGLDSFNKAIIDLVFADSVDKSRVCAVQAPGGSGALRISADVIYRVKPETKVWLSDPTWANHAAIFNAAGLKTASYPYLDTKTKMVDEVKFLAAVAGLGKDDMLVLHGCCHNPTGSDISFDAWIKVAELAIKNGFGVFVDFAYQGFGDGLDDDSAGLRKLASMVENLIVTSSCSKNFGLYNERVGCAMFLGKDSTQAETVLTHFSASNRVAYSMPPNHGAEIVSLILNDANLRQMWLDELAIMRGRIHSIRKQLSAELANLTQTHDWDFITKQNGMFSLLCLDEPQIKELIADSIYIAGRGRSNIAGLKNEEQIKRFAKAIYTATKK